MNATTKDQAIEKLIEAAKEAGRSPNEIEALRKEAEGMLTKATNEEGFTSKVLDHFKSNWGWYLLGVVVSTSVYLTYKRAKETQEVEGQAMLDDHTVEAM
jgi:hypothetical protein